MFGIDNKDRSALKTINNVRKAIHWEKTILEWSMSRLVGKLVKSGQYNNIVSTHFLIWESRTTVGIRMGTLVESGASPLTQINNGSTALFQMCLKVTEGARLLG